MRAAVTYLESLLRVNSWVKLCAPRTEPGLGPPLYVVLGTVQCMDWGHVLGRRTDRLVSVHSKTITIRGGLRLVDKHADVFRCKAVIDGRGQRINCSHVVVEEGYVGADRKKLATPTRFVSRAVLITDSSVLLSDSDQQVSMVTVPPVAAGCPAVRMVELCPSTMTCMPGTYLVHLTCQSSGSAYEDLSPVVTRMFRVPESHDRENCPSVLWCLYFNMADGSGLQAEGHDLPSNVHMCSGPDGGLSHEHAVRQAESIFNKILPEEDFCPPAPNPEDIIYDGDATGEEEKDGAGEEKDGAGEEKQEKDGAGEEKQEKDGAGEEKQEKDGAGEEKDGAGEAEHSLQTEE